MKAACVEPPSGHLIYPMRRVAGPLFTKVLLNRRSRGTLKRQESTAASHEAIIYKGETYAHR